MENKLIGTIRVEIGAGELIDKITILEIKAQRISDPAKLNNVRHELEILNQAHATHLVPSMELTRLTNELRRVNEALWVIEDEIRACEASKDFGPTFIELARSVYIQNDKRAAIKKVINELCGSSIVEEKSYTEFS